VVVGSLALRDHAERLSGFSHVMGRDYPHLTVLPALEGRDDNQQTEHLCRDLLARRPDVVGLYNVGAGNEGIAVALQQAAHRPLFIGHDLTPNTRQYLTNGLMAALVHQDPGHQARSAARVLFALATAEPIHAAQEKIRIEIILRDNLP